MRFCILILSLCLVWTSTASAFLYELKMHSSLEIKEMSNEQLLDAYLDAKIEERASAEFHEGAGFSNAKEYQMRKQLLRYIIFLRKEMQERALEPDPIADWLN